MAESSARQLKNICVFCGTDSENFSDFINAAKELGMVLGERKICLMYGSGDVRFMGFIPEVMATGGKEIALITHEKLLELNNNFDAFIALPGGLKLIEEIFTIASWSQQKRYQKPIGLLNINNFYSLLLFFLDGAVMQGFLPIPARKIFVHANTANELIDMLQAYRPEIIPVTPLLTYGIGKEKKDDDKEKKDDSKRKKDDDSEKKDDKGKDKDDDGKNDEDKNKKLKTMDLGLHL